MNVCRLGTGISTGSPFLGRVFCLVSCFLGAMNQQGSGRACIFCGATDDLTKEHLWPSWFNKVLPNVHTHRVTLERPGEEASSWVRSNIADQEIAYVCGTCNHGWMSGLERAVKPSLIPMFRGRHYTLDQPQQRALAAWAFKTAIIGEYLDPPNAVIPFEVRSALVRRSSDLPEFGEPPRGATVFLAGIDPRWGSTQQFANYRLVPLRPSHGDPPAEGKGYVATILVTYVALQVLWNPSERLGIVGHDPEVAARTARIWPFERSFQWPPGPILPVEGIPALINAFRR
jgi:hypothetical protein